MFLLVGTYSLGKGSYFLPLQIQRKVKYKHKILNACNS